MTDDWPILRSPHRIKILIARPASESEEEQTADIPIEERLRLARSGGCCGATGHPSCCLRFTHQGKKAEDYFVVRGADWLDLHGKDEGA